MVWRSTPIIRQCEEWWYLSCVEIEESETSHAWLWRSLIYSVSIDRIAERSLKWGELAMFLVRGLDCCNRNMTNSPHFSDLSAIRWILTENISERHCHACDVSLSSISTQERYHHSSHWRMTGVERQTTNFVPSAEWSVKRRGTRFSFLGSQIAWNSGNGISLF